MKQTRPFEIRARLLCPAGACATAACARFACARSNAARKGRLAMDNRGLGMFLDEVFGRILRVESDFGNGFVRLRVSEAQRRQANRSIRCVEDAVIEMLRNARDAHARNIFLATARSADLRTVTMVDDGDGVPQDMCERIFEPRVTSKLDAFSEDDWGVHGRGMALYSIKENAAEAWPWRHSVLGEGGAAMSCCISRCASCPNVRRSRARFPSCWAVRAKGGGLERARATSRARRRSSPCRAGRRARCISAVLSRLRRRCALMGAVGPQAWPRCMPQSIGPRPRNASLCAPMPSRCRSAHAGSVSTCLSEAHIGFCRERSSLSCRFWESCATARRATMRDRALGATECGICQGV